MIYSYRCVDGRLVDAEGALDAAVWIDLVEPTAEEIAQVEAAYAVEIPSADEMKEIEVSSRLHQTGRAQVLTTNIIYRVESEDPLDGEVTFLLAPEAAITLRFAKPRAFLLFANQARAGDIACSEPAEVLIGLLEAIVEREADLIERLQAKTLALSEDVFSDVARAGGRARRHAEMVKRIGRASVISSRARESLVSQGRLLTHFLDVSGGCGASDGVQNRIRTSGKDVAALAAHVDHLSARLSFLLDAAIGLVGIEQNQIIKLFSVVAVMLMPPTLIASVYGMNFQHMPEIGAPYAYPIVLGAMAASALAPYLYFRRKGWL